MKWLPDTSLPTFKGKNIRWFPDVFSDLKNKNKIKIIFSKCEWPPSASPCTSRKKIIGWLSNFIFLSHFPIRKKNWVVT